MTERLFRLVLLLLVSLLFIPLIWQGRGARQQEPTAFLRYSSGMTIVKASGNVLHPGIYRFHDGPTLNTVINMAIPREPLSANAEKLFGTRLQCGQIIKFYGNKGKTIEISIENMKAQERMLLGIPLDPDMMDYDDWLSLPGIGPNLSRTIVLDRQQNGGFGSLAGLERVPGVGRGKIDMIEKYFRK